MQYILIAIFSFPSSFHIFPISLRTQIHTFSFFPSLEKAFKNNIKIN